MTASTRRAAGSGPVGSAATFPQAVASFDPTPERVLLWTRVVGRDRVRWHVARDPDGEQLVVSGEVAVPAGHDGCVTVDVGGLRPATRYYYWFSADGVRSRVGRTRTLPDGPTDRFRLAVACCADHSIGYLTGYRAIARSDVDLVLHLGDYIYESPGSGDDREPDPPGTVVDLDGYRRRHAAMRCDPDLQALHLQHPMVAIWDDHDIADNAWRGGAKAHDPAEHGSWPDRLAAAAQARQEWVPARLPPGHDERTLWRSVALGDLARLVVMDSRLVGRDAQAGEPGARPLDDPDRSLLGDEQRAWLRHEVAEGQEPWCLLASQIVVNPIRFPVPADADLPAGTPSGYAVIDGDALCTDEWDGYPAERERLLAMIADRREGDVVLLSGDVHSSWAFEGPPRTEGAPITVEMTAPAITSLPAGRHLPGPVDDVLGGVLEDLVDRATPARWADLFRNGYLVLHVTRAAVRGHWFASDPHEREQPPELMATWEVRAGDPGRLVEVAPGEHEVPRPADDDPPRWPPPAHDLDDERTGRRRRILVGLATVVAVAGAAWRWWAWHDAGHAHRHPRWFPPRHRRAGRPRR